MPSSSCKNRGSNYTCKSLPGDDGDDGPCIADGGDDNNDTGDDKDITRMTTLSTMFDLNVYLRRWVGLRVGVVTYKPKALFKQPSSLTL